MSPEPIDEVAVAQLEELEPGLFEQLATLFSQEYPADVARLTASLAGEDLLDASKAAHRLKGSSAAMAAPTVAAAAAKVEASARDGDHASAAREHQRLLQALEDFETALAKRRSGVT